MDLGVIEAGEVAKLVDEYGLEGGERYLEIATARVIHPVDELAVQEGQPFDDLGTRRNRVAVGERPEATPVGIVGNRRGGVPAYWHAVGGDDERATAEGHTRSRQQHDDEC